MTRFRSDRKSDRINSLYTNVQLEQNTTSRSDIRTTSMACNKRERLDGSNYLMPQIETAISTNSTSHKLRLTSEGTVSVQ